jgi:hypothetical protein
MGSFAFVTVDGYPIRDTKNYFDRWFFKNSDRKIVSRKKSERNRLIWGAPDPCKVDDLEDVYIYEVTAKILKKRLDLAGWTRSVAEDEFKQDIAARLEQIQDYDNEQLGDYCHHVPALKNATFDHWLTKLKEVLQRKLLLSRWGQVVRHNDVIIDILVNPPSYQFDEELSLEINFPSRSFEGIARACLEVVPEEAICVLDVTDLVGGGWVDAFDDLIEYSKEFTSFYDVFAAAIMDIQGLMLLSPENSILAKLLYANAITAMETYLSDTLKKNVLMRPPLLRRFVESHEGFSDKKIPMAQVFQVLSEMQDRVSDVLDRVVFHNIPKTIEVYSKVFDVRFPRELSADLIRAVALRHDIVHRNGKDNAGRVIPVTMSDVEQILELVDATIKAIDVQVREGLIDDEDGSSESA